MQVNSPLKGRTCRHVSFTLTTHIRWPSTPPAAPGKETDLHGIKVTVVVPRHTLWWHWWVACREDQASALQRAEASVVIAVSHNVGTVLWNFPPKKNIKGFLCGVGGLSVRTSAYTPESLQDCPTYLTTNHDEQQIITRQCYRQNPTNLPFEPPPPPLPKKEEHASLAVDLFLRDLHWDVPVTLTVLKRGFNRGYPNRY